MIGLLLHTVKDCKPMLRLLVFRGNAKSNASDLLVFDLDIAYTMSQVESDQQAENARD